MPQKLTIQDGRKSLNEHVAFKGAELREKYGPEIGWNQLLQILQDPGCVRYPCEVAFDAARLQPGELAYPAPKGRRPEEGYIIYVHPYFALQPQRVPLVVLYQLVVVNYGEFASALDAETFGASALGITTDQYYGALCEMADEIGGGVE
ncbi:MAG: hypothetical protein ABSG59_09655 [Verrucomicrobiota bacterium]|jgi:hypothetical protein